MCHNGTKWFFLKKDVRSKPARHDTTLAAAAAAQVGVTEKRSEMALKTLLLQKLY
jgi:hypothetical protein